MSISLQNDGFYVDQIIAWFEMKFYVKGKT